MADQPKPSAPSVPSTPRTDPSNVPNVPADRTTDTSRTQPERGSDPMRTTHPSEPRRSE